MDRQLGSMLQTDRNEEKQLEAKREFLYGEMFEPGLSQQSQNQLNQSPIPKEKEKVFVQFE